MKKMIWAAVVGGVVMMNAPAAKAGDREWATVGKVLTGVAAAGFVASVIDSHARVSVSYNPPVFCAPAPVVCVPVPAIVYTPPPRMVHYAPAPVVVYRGPVYRGPHRVYGRYAHPEHPRR